MRYYRGLKARSISAPPVNTGPRWYRTNPAPAAQSVINRVFPDTAAHRPPDHARPAEGVESCHPPTREWWRENRSARPNRHQPERRAARDETARRRPAQLRRPDLPPYHPCPDHRRSARPIDGNSLASNARRPVSMGQPHESSRAVLAHSRHWQRQGLFARTPPFGLRRAHGNTRESAKPAR